MNEPDPEVDALAFRVIGAAIEVHRVSGPGYLERVYEEALCVEFGLREIPFARQVPVAVLYKGHRVGEGYLDYLVGEHLIVELKAVASLLPIHEAQMISYLRSKGAQIGLLINFNLPVLKDGVRRLAHTGRLD